MSFKTINLEEYKKLLKNKKKMFDMTFPTPESLNKYRDDDNKIDQKILHDEEIKKQNKNLSEMVDKNLDKYFNEKTNNTPFVVDMLNLGNNSTDLIKVDKHENKNVLKDVFEIDNQYKFDNDENILDRFDKAFKNYKIIYTPYKKGKFVNVNYLLDKLDVSENLPREIYNHFNSNSTNLRKKTRKIPVDYNDDGQMLLKGGSVNNNIQIKDLDKGILRVRYSSSRKLSNKLLKDDYKISKRMVNAIKFYKDIHKLPANEKKHLL